MNARPENGASSLAWTLLDFAVVVRALHRRNVGRRWKIVDHGIEHRLHALVLECGTAQHRENLVVDGACSQPALDFGRRQFSALEVLVHQFLARLGGGLHHLLAPFLAQAQHLRRNLPFVVFHALRAIIPVDRFHPEEVDHALEFILGPDGPLHRHGCRLEPSLDLIIDTQEIRAGPVHLVDEEQARHAVLVALPPHGLGLRLYPAYCAQYRARAIQYAQAAFDFNREIDVAWRIDDVDPMLRIVIVHPLPEACRRGGGNGNAALLLLFHPVHDGGAVVDLTQLVRHTGIEQDALRGRGLAGVDVRHDADVAIALDGCLAWHCSKS